MTKKFEELIKEAKEVKLGQKEKVSIRHFLLSLIEKNPVRENGFNRHKAVIKPEAPTVEPGSLEGSAAWSKLNIFNKAGILFSLRFRLNKMAIVLIVALLIAGGATVSAENALPGDILFPVKISVNEKARALFALSDEAKAKVEVKLAERRLEEAAKLAAEGRLNADAGAQVELNFEEFADRVETRIEKMKVEGKANAALEATSNFEAALEAHKAILEKLVEIKADTDVGVNLIPIKAVVELKLKEANESKVKVEKEIKGQVGADVKAAAEGKLTAATNKLAEARAFIDRAKADLGAEAAAKAEAKLKAAESALAEGKTKLEAGAFGEAFILFQEAHRIAQEAKLKVENQQELKLELKFESDEEMDEEEIKGKTKIESEGELKIKIRFFGSPSSSPSPSPSPTP